MWGIRLIRTRGIGFECLQRLAPFNGGVRFPTRHSFTGFDGSNICFRAVACNTKNKNKLEPIVVTNVFDIGKMPDLAA